MDHDVEEKKCKTLALRVAVFAEHKNIKTNTTDIFGSPDPVEGVVEGTRVVEIVTTAALVCLGSVAGVEKVPKVVLVCGTLKTTAVLKTDDECVDPHKLPNGTVVKPGISARLTATFTTIDGKAAVHHNTTMEKVPVHSGVKVILAEPSYDDVVRPDVTKEAPNEVAVGMDEETTDKHPLGEESIVEDKSKGSCTGAVDGLATFAPVSSGSSGEVRD